MSAFIYVYGVCSTPAFFFNLYMWPDTGLFVPHQSTTITWVLPEASHQHSVLLSALPFQSYSPCNQENSFGRQREEKRRRLAAGDCSWWGTVSAFCKRLVFSFLFPTRIQEMHRLLMHYDWLAGISFSFRALSGELTNQSPWVGGSWSI